MPASSLYSGRKYGRGRNGERTGIGQGNFEYGNILEFLSLLLYTQRNSSMDARIRMHCAWTRIASDALLFLTHMQ